MSQQEFYETVQRQQEWEEQMKSNTGGPVFPTPAHNLNNDGMTLRDYFAAKAMQAMTNRFEANEGLLAIYSYKVADAMLKAREA